VSLLLRRCATIVHTIDGEIVTSRAIPQPAQRRRAVPKAAAIYQLHKNPTRDQGVAPQAGARQWEEVDLDGRWTVSRAREKDARRNVRDRLSTAGWSYHTLGILALGGATLDNEWNHTSRS